MKETDRRVVESPLFQGVDERIAYELTTTPWGSDPSSPAAVLKDADGTDVTSTYMTGSASASGDVITTPVVHSLVDGERYRLEIKFTISGNVLETWAWIFAQV